MSLRVSMKSSESNRAIDGDTWQAPRRALARARHRERYASHTGARRQFLSEGFSCSSIHS